MLKTLFHKLRAWPRGILFAAAGFLAIALILSVFFACRASSVGEPETQSPASSAENPPEASGDAISSNDGQDPENAESDLSGGAAVSSEDLSSAPSTDADGHALTHGIDVSKWQGKIDWDSVKRSGLDFAIIRIGYRGEDGVLYRDENADYNLQSAHRAGLKLGVYFFSTATTTAEALEEAEFTLNAICGYPISYPVVYDCEGFLNPESRLFSLTHGERTENAAAFLSAVQEAGYTPMLYSGVQELSGGYWSTDALPGGTLIWAAQYPDVTYPKKERPDCDGQVDAWQYTDRGSVPGIVGNVDMVVCYFSPAFSEAKDPDGAPKNVTVPKSEDELLYTPVSERVTAKELVNLREGATTKAEIVATLKNGEVLERVGVGTNGWSRLDYNGEFVYAITSYLTTDLTARPPETTPKQDVVDGCVFTPTSERVTAKIEVNLRDAPNTNAAVVAVLKHGEFLECTAIGDRGWSRLNYNGRNVYAITNYLTDVLTEQPSDIEPEITDGFTPTSEQVTAKSETNLRTAPSTVNSEVVYTLKNGEYVTRIGLHPNGWSRLIYNGQEVYAITSYLTN